MTTRTTLAATAAAIAVFAATAGQAETWRYATEEAAASDVQNVFAQKFKEEIEANTDHEIQLFPFGTLGESDDIMEQAKAGVLQFVTQSPGFTGATIPEAQVFFVPYLLPQDPDQLVEFFRTSTAINEMFPELYAQHGLELLSMYPEGEVCMTTQEEVRSPADLNEVKFRTMTNPLLVQSYQAFGATPTPLPWGEVYGALQTGIIQGQENPGFFLESTKIYEVTDVITCIGHNNFTTAVMANKQFFDGLSEEDQQAVEDAIAAAFDHIVVYQQELQNVALDNIKEAKPDMVINILSDEERAPFRDAAKSVEEEFISMTGEGGQAILDQMKADAEAVQ